MNGSKGPFLLVPGFILAPGFALATDFALPADFMHFFLTMSGNVENKVEIGKTYLPRVSISPNLFPKKCNLRQKTCKLFAISSRFHGICM